jgi:hypothetical protein
MKKLALIMILLFISISAKVIAQNKDDQSYPWSLSFAYSPKINISKNSINLSFGDQTYFTSFDYKIDHRFSKHFSFAIGVDINKVSTNINYQSYNGANYQDENYSIKTVLMELPIQLNFHFRDTSKILDPYVKIAFRMGFFYQRTENYSYGFENYEGIRYQNFLDMGLGSYLELSQRISFKYETSFGYGINYIRKNYFYFEGLIGLRYTLKNKKANS